MRFRDIPDPFPNRGNYRIDIPWQSIEGTLEQWALDQTVETDPDFQRAHVWTKDKQVAYVEYIMRGGYAAREIYWNCPTWMSHAHPEAPIQLVDGKQRLEAVRTFLRGDLLAFGCRADEFDHLDIMTCNMSWYINNLQTRADVLKWYLGLNAGGVVHTRAELDKVRRMLKEEGRG